jgi:hypothetical protein
LTKIGTGEGAQSYGHGLYFAEREGIARHYQKTTSEQDFIRKAQELYNEFDSPSDAHAELAASKDFTPGQKRLLDALEKDDWLGFDYPHQAVRAALRDAKNFDLSPETKAAVAEVGNIYKVRINANKDHFLDWDKPLSEQSEFVRNALLNHPDPMISGTFAKHGEASVGAAYNRIAQRLGGERMMGPPDKQYGPVAYPDEALASKALAEAGIPGIKYLDQGSRGKAEGSRNYVVFDDKSVEITPAPTVSAPRKFGPQHQPDETRSLFQFLASRGGLKPDPDLKSILDGNPFVPGFGKLLREGGLSADRAWEAVVEAGYINEPGRHFDIPLQTDHREIYRMVEEEARGNKQYRVGVEPPVSQAEARTRAAQHRAEMEGELDTVLREAGHDPAGFDPSVKKRALQIMQKEGIADPEIAFERAVMENAERFERNARARRQQAEEIPGWDLPADAGTAPRDRRPDRAAGPAGEPAGKPGDGAAGEGASGGGRPDRAAGEATTVIGNPALAKDAERVLAEAGGDFEIHVEQADGSTRRMSAREAIAEAEDDARAAAELTDCIGEEIPF